MEGKRAKGQEGFRRNHSTIDHIVKLRIIAEEWHNNKSHLFCFFVDFRKYFYKLPRNNLGNRLEELKVHFELRVATIRLYNKFIVKFKNNEGWTTEAGCVDTILDRIVIILLLYANDIVLMERRPSNLDKQLRILKYFCSHMGMFVNTDKKKIMIIKSRKDAYANLIYDNRNLEEVTYYQYLKIDIHHKLNWNYSIEKRINGGWKAYFGLENNCK